MADDKALAEVEIIMHHHRQHVSDNFPSPGICVRRCDDKWPCEAYRAAAALDAALKRHQPRQLYGFIADENHPGRCPHDPDRDWDQHFEDDGMWYCRDKPVLQVCVSCADGPDGDMWAEWPCPTYADIATALLGEAQTGGV